MEWNGKKRKENEFRWYELSLKRLIPALCSVPWILKGKTRVKEKSKIINEAPLPPLSTACFANRLLETWSDFSRTARFDHHYAKVINYWRLGNTAFIWFYVGSLLLYANEGKKFKNRARRGECARRCSIRSPETKILVETLDRRQGFVVKDVAYFFIFSHELPFLWDIFGCYLQAETTII